MPVGATDNEEHNAGFATTIVISDVMLFRDGISAGLQRIGQLKIVGAFCPDDGLKFIARTCVQLVILDMSRRRALAHAMAIKQACPQTQIVAFGIGTNEDALAGAETGIAAFVGEDGSVDDINAAALSALNGRSFCSPELTAQLLSHIARLANSRSAQPHAQLTAREDEIAALVGRGLSNKQIAQELRISPATVKNHVHSILEKLELPRRSAIGGHRRQPAPTVPVQATNAAPRQWAA